MTEISFFVPVQPFGKQRPIVCRNGVAFTPEKTRNAEQEIRAYFVDNYKNFAPFEGAIEARIDFVLLRPKSRKKDKHCVTGADLDNMAKLVCDALNKYAYLDDKQIVKMTLVKRFASENEVFGIHIFLKEMEV